MSSTTITPSTVQELARRRQVLPAPDYHATQHFVRWEDAIFALETCYRVQPDRRHPNSFIAFGHFSRNQQARIDFRLGENEEGQLIFVVTAFPVEARPNRNW